MTRLIGDLVTSKYLDGIGKILSIDEVEQVSVVTFFESPEDHSARPQTVRLESLEDATLHDECVIYCIHPLHKKWQRARYGGQRPNNGHLVIFRRGEDDVVLIHDIYVINIGSKRYLDPRAYLSQRCNDTPLFLNYRSRFIKSYIEQRRSCRSISSVLSSGIELEAYQLAVVRRVLQDDIKKYLLADEVGLGKTIEAGMIIRELVVEDYRKNAIIAVPESLIEQWTEELTQRFFLEAMLDENIVICSHEDLYRSLKKQDVPPSIIVIDEAHLIADWGWSSDIITKQSYEFIAEVCADSEVCLLLSGTPLNGNETNFLSMLHLLNSSSYPLTDAGVSDFKVKISERESLGGIYQALTPANDNTTLSDLLDQIRVIISADIILDELINVATPLVDWLEGEEEGEDRAGAIQDIRLYLGENYRIHQRMLRNRREDAYIASLFPGLDGVEILPWSIDERTLSIEQSLDAFRSEYLSNDTPTNAITQGNYRNWIEKALNNPMSIAEHATIVLADMAGSLQGFESDFLEELIECAKEEQEEKDYIFLIYIDDWLESNPTGKIVVFAGDRDTANSITFLLHEKYGDVIEHHVPGESLRFVDDDATRILVCDKNGEDGLNLHGGKKLVVHYDLPLSISRIEQRLGRVNRYSADIIALPIQSIVFRPHSESYSHHWLNLLNDGIGIFDKSVASLQYVLEPVIEEAWRDVCISGNSAIAECTSKLQGESGLIYRERLRVQAQEQLNSLESEIIAAQEYSSQIIASDDQAEMQANEMQDWITNGLLFRRKKGEVDSTFRYQYMLGTLMDSATFTTKCLLGVDFINTTASAPVTHLMSFDRAICSQGNNVQPFRYGQPFLNTIYDALRTDGRGISAAQVRYIRSKNPIEPIPCFKIEWLISHKNSNQVIGDEIYPPTMVTQWLDQQGEPIQKQAIIDLLTRAYNKDDGGRHKDVNLRSERWAAIEENFPENEWSELVNTVYESGARQVSESIDSDLVSSLNTDCLAYSVIIIASM